ncbi:MAG: helix-turn-helix domain-containing protein [Candidatus Paracaedibacteraceae bacterium]|nr:helix-turn-helix domain-containing protein [Candidatus Paracaedibacteraceae bacterium]
MPDTDFLNIGHNLRMLRKLRGISQAALGQMIGVSGQMIQKYETGQSQVSSKMLHLLAEKLNADIRQFFDGGEGFVDLSEDGATYEVEVDDRIKDLIKVYSQLSNDDKDRLIAMANVLSSLKKDKS